MPVEVRSDNAAWLNVPTPDAVVVSCTGVVTGEALVNANDHLSHDKQHRFQVWDFSEAVRVDFDQEQVHALARQDWHIAKGYRLIAIVIIGDQWSVHSLVESYEFMSNKWVGRNLGFQSRHFESRADAADWLAGLA